MTGAPATGFFGKLPSHGDFVRLRATSATARRLVTLLEDGVGSSQPVPATGPVEFFLAGEGGEPGLAGVITASQDKVGRRFPLAVFLEVAPAGDANLAEVVAGAAEELLAAALSLAGEAPRLDAAALGARVDQLPGLQSGDLALARERLEGEAREVEMHSLLPGGPESGRGDVAAYALHCLRQACARAMEPGGGALGLGGVAASPLGRWAWLRIARRWGASASSAFWSCASPGTLVVVPARVPAGVLRSFGGAQPDPRIWPLTTNKEGAAATARGALPIPALQVLQRSGSSVAELLAALEP